jgi:DNA-binding NtrC family response regulator
MNNGLPFSILIVDDDEDDREIVDQAFGEINYEAEVKKFIDGKFLFKYLEQIEQTNYPSLIVLDNSLPGLDVENILLMLKGNINYKEIPVVIYSGAISNAKSEKLLQMGAYRIIEKGNSMDEIVNVAKELKLLAEKNKASDLN